MEFHELLTGGSDFLDTHDAFTVISHSDADGICATAIIKAYADHAEKDCTLQFIQQISNYALEQLAKRTKGPVVFVDMGSTHLAAISKHFAKCDVLIIDHHQVENGNDAMTNDLQLLVNPFLAGLDGMRDICSAGIAYEIVKKLLKSADADPLGVIALIAAQADNQERGAFQGYNKKILDHLEAEGFAEHFEGARLFGVQSKPLPQLIAYSHDLRIDGLTRDVPGTMRFLRNLDIDTRQKRYFGQLSPREKECLHEALIAASPNPEARITHYVLPRNPRGALRDTREAASLLNACGRLDRPELAVRLLFGDADALDESWEVQREYRLSIKAAHQWYEDASRAGEIVEGDGVQVLYAADKIPSAIAGTLCSMLTRGREVLAGTVVVCLARTKDGTCTTKVSGRTTGDTDIAALMKRCAEPLGGEGGGHANAAGALIPSENEHAFIDAVLKEFS